MKRTLLAALGILASASASWAVELKVIDRKPVGNGAEVVLELVKEDGPATYYQYAYRALGGNEWVFYRKLVHFKRPDESENRDYSWRATKINALKFNDTQVSVFFVDVRECVVVTLDTDANNPQVYEDRFYAEGGKLLAVDELELFDPADSRFGVKFLNRTREGIWWFEGKPYERKSDCKVSSIPLPPMLEVLGLKLKTDNGIVGKDVPDYARGVEFIRRYPIREDTLSTTRNRINEWVPLIFFDSSPLNQLLAMRKWLRKRPGSFFKSKATYFLTPTLAGGRDFPLFGLIDIIRLIYRHDGILSLSKSVRSSLDGTPIEYDLDTCRATAADLPCFATDYDKAVAKISAIYDVWQKCYESHLRNSIHQCSLNVPF